MQNPFRDGGPFDITMGLLSLLLSIALLWMGIQMAQHERHFSVKISPVTPAPHIMHTDKTAGQEPFTAGSRIATHSK